MCMYVGHLAGLERWIRYKKNLKVQNRVIMHVIRLITCGPGARIGPTRPSPPRDGWSTRQRVRNFARRWPGTWRRQSSAEDAGTGCSAPCRVALRLRFSACSLLFCDSMTLAAFSFCSSTRRVFSKRLR